MNNTKEKRAWHSNHTTNIQKLLATYAKRNAFRTAICRHQHNKLQEAYLPHESRPQSDAFIAVNKSVELILLQN